MPRPLDWQPLASADPVPGDPDEVLGAAAGYLEVAAAIEAAAADLRVIADAAAMTSRAVDAFRERARSVADDIERAHTRYEGVGRALERYAGALGAAQDEADAALAQAKDADARRTSALSAVAGAEAALGAAQRALATTAADPDVTPQQQRTGADAVSRARGRLTAAGADLDQADADLAAARRRLERAEADRDAAAATAAAAVHDVRGSGDLDDGWWDDWGARALAVVTDVAGTVAAVAGVAALLVGWIPVVGQALAAVLGTVALVAGLVNLVGNTVLAATGERSWTEAGLSALAVATFGVGRAVMAPARAARGAVPAAVRRGAGRVAATSVSSRAAAGLPAGGSARATIAALTGRPGTAALSRNQARAALAASRRAGHVQWTAPVRSGWQDVRALPGQLRTVRDGAGDAVRALRPGSPVPSVDAAAWARSLGLGDDIPDVLRTVHAAHPALRASDDVRPHLVKAGVLTGVSAGAFGTQVALDTGEVVELFLPADDPVERLRLPVAP